MALNASAIIHVDLLSPAIHSRIVNASPRGLMLEMPEARPLGTLIRIAVDIEGAADQICVSGIIVHAARVESVDPHFVARVGILLTETGPDWLELCQRLAQRPSSSRPVRKG